MRKQRYIRIHTVHSRKIENLMNFAAAVILVALVYAVAR